MKRLIMTGLALATAHVPAHADDGRYLIEQMPIMDFYMQIVPPGLEGARREWRLAVPDAGTRTDPRSQSADEQRRDHLRRPQNVRGAADTPAADRSARLKPASMRRYVAARAAFFIDWTTIACRMKAE